LAQEGGNNERLENMCNGDLQDMYFSPNIIQMIRARRMRWAGCTAYMEEKRNAEKVLVGKPEGKRPPSKHWHRWEDNI
jgi:hypothetical protein